MPPLFPGFPADDALRQVIQVAQKKCEGFINFAQWAYFGSGTIARGSVEDHQVQSPDCQSDDFSQLPYDAQAFKELDAEGMKLIPELAAAFSPYRTHRGNCFGKYELRERNLDPIDYGVTFQM